MKKLFRVFLLKLGKLFYDQNYLVGKYFTPNSIGARWILQSCFWQKIMRYNADTPWPASHRVEIANPRNIEFHPDDMQIFHSFGSYFQALDGKIIIGRGTWIAPNVGLITTNHDLYDPNNHMPGKDIILGEKSWIGMNSVILPGVVLGPGTVVGAGSVVTKSFPEGHCVIVGVPAKKIKSLVIDRIKNEKD